MALPRHVRFVAAFALSAALLPLSHSPQAVAQQAAAPSDNQSDDEENPTPAPLTLGSMAIASDAALGIENMAVDVSVDQVSYAYKLRNKGKDKLNLSASIAFPDLEVNNEGTSVYLLPSRTPENVVDLAVKSNGTAIATTPHVEAIALGIDHLAELKAQNIPLIPFGEEIETALGGMKPDALAKLEALGLVTPRDPAQPDTPVIADWSLHVVHGWTQPLEPNASTDVTISFKPIKAVYKIDAASLVGFDALKEQVCLTPQRLAEVKALLKAKNSTADVADITLANDGPARWLDNPPASVAVRKPSMNSIVVFCGMEANASPGGVVKGKMPGSSEAGGLRVLVFTRNDAPQNTPHP